MIEEKATVLRTEGKFAWVETQRKSACQACSVNKGCGTATISKVVGQKRTEVKVLNPLQLAQGEQVVVGLQEDALVKGSLMLYALPLLMMFLAGLSGQVIAGNFSMANEEPLTIIFSLAGLAAGFYLVSHFTKTISDDERYQAVILRRDEAVVEFVK